MERLNLLGKKLFDTIGNAKSKKYRKIVVAERFQTAANCERLRIFRRASFLSVLLIDFSPLLSQEELFQFDAILDRQLSPIDTAGLLSAREAVVLLPGLPGDEAYSIRDEIQSECMKRGMFFDSRIEVYPSKHGPSLNSETEHVGISFDNLHPNELESVERLFALPTPFWKRTLDVTGALFGLASTAPILFPAALLIKVTSRGPVIFTQEREGIGGKRFMMYKLRTMYIDAESRRPELLAKNEQDGPAFKIKEDPRVTKFGRFLRKFSIDEIPQLWNVVRGDMSLVGPRPLPVTESRMCEIRHRQRLDVKPGITCIWQVRGRNRVSFEEWMKMDQEYVRRRSLLFDLGLLAATIPAVASGRGAY